jgi:hypothetical protein
MTFEEFQGADCARWKGPLLALWFAGRGEWERAHEVAQEIEDRDGAWVHAHLHRQEGDAANASYWYRRAGRPVATAAIQAEWEAMVRELLPGSD